MKTTDEPQGDAVKALREALEPFAKLADAINQADDEWPDSQTVYVTLGDCRRALRVIKSNEVEPSRIKAALKIARTFVAGTDDGDREYILNVIDDALNLSAPDAVAAEPVAWRWRDFPDEPWTYEPWDFISDGGLTILRDHTTVEPLYRQPPPPASTPDLDAWIEREFSGNGVALRLETDPPDKGEPFMSMATAKELTRRAVREVWPASTEGGKPVAWMRGHHTPSSPHGPDEWNVDFVYGDDSPEGDGWVPLYRRPQ